MRDGPLARFISFADYARDQWVAEQAQKLPQGARVLDVGAGPCRYRDLFAHCSYESQDFMQYEGSPERRATEKNRWHYGKIDYVSDATAIPVPDGSFDVILCTEVLEHVPEPIPVIREFARILRDGGRLLLTCPLGSGLHQEPYHYYGGYTPYWYQRFLPEAGFGDIRVTPNGGFFKHYGQESQRFSTKIDPRNLGGTARIALMPIWLLTFPWFRLVMPLACYYLDRIDSHRGFTVGYHITAEKHDS